jgi:hypothetical protein
LGSIRRQIDIVMTEQLVIWAEARRIPLPFKYQVKELVKGLGSGKEHLPQAMEESIHQMHPSAKIVAGKASSPSMNVQMFRFDVIRPALLFLTDPARCVGCYIPQDMILVNMSPQCGIFGITNGTGSLEAHKISCWRGSNSN